MPPEPIADVLARVRMYHPQSSPHPADIDRLLAIVESVVAKEQEWRKQVAVLNDILSKGKPDPNLEEVTLLYENCADELAALLRGDGDAD